MGNKSPGDSPKVQSPYINLKFTFCGSEEHVSSRYINVMNKQERLSSIISKRGDDIYRICMTVHTGT